MVADWFNRAGVFNARRDHARRIHQGDEMREASVERGEVPGQRYMDVSFSLRIPADLLASLKIAAGMNNESASNALRRFARLYIDDTERKMRLRYGGDNHEPR
jgi:hypothetical protein